MLTRRRDPVDRHHQREQARGWRRNPASRSGSWRSAAGSAGTCMLAMIERRSWTALRLLATVIVISWKGMIEQASARPDGVRPPVEDERHQQHVDADERERVDQPLHQLPPAAAVARSQVRVGEDPQLIRRCRELSQPLPIERPRRHPHARRPLFQAVRVLDDRAMIGPGQAQRVDGERPANCAIALSPAGRRRPEAAARALDRGNGTDLPAFRRLDQIDLGLRALARIGAGDPNRNRRLAP